MCICMVMHYLMEAISQLASSAILVRKCSSSDVLSVLICHTYMHVGFVMQLAMIVIKNIIYINYSYLASYAPNIHVNIILIHYQYTRKIKYPVINKSVLNFAFYNGSKVVQELNKYACSYRIAQQLVSYQNTAIELQVLTVSHSHYSCCQQILGNHPS